MPSPPDVARGPMYPFRVHPVPAIEAQLSEPSGIAVDRTGNLYIADEGRVRMVSPLGTIQTVAGGGSAFPSIGVAATSVEMNTTSVAVDNNGNLCIADAIVGLIVRVSPAGIITLVAGLGIVNGVTNTGALFGELAGLAVDSTVQYAGTAPSEVAGLLQVNVLIPAGIQEGGYVPVTLQVGDASTTPDAVWIALASN